MDAGSDTDTITFGSRTGSVQAEALLRRASQLSERIGRLGPGAGGDGAPTHRSPPGVGQDAVADLARTAGQLRALAADLVHAGSGRSIEAPRYQAILDLIAHPCAVTDADGTVTAVNEGWCALTGRSAAQLVDQDITGLLDRDEQDRVPHEQLLEARNGNGEDEWGGRLRVADGESLDVVLRCRVDREERSGVALQLLWTARAVADQPRVRELQNEVDRVASLEKVKSDHLKLVGHELRGSVGLVRGYLAMLEDGSLGKLPAGAERVLPVVTSRLDQMNRLVTQMLDTARLEDSRLDLHRRAADLRDIARHAAEVMEPVAGLATIRLEVNTGHDPVPVDVDVSRIETIVTNLLDNALKYAPGTERVRCTVHVDGQHAVLSVSDEGIGLSPDGVRQLFRRFGRVVTADNRHIPGTGLGLYLAREFARLHGGDLVVTSTLHAGSTFSLRLPLAGA